MERKNKYLLSIAIISLMLFFWAILSPNVLAAEKDYTYLSDLDYITTNNWSYAGWGTINKDLPPEGKVITLKVNGKTRQYLKGMGLHANSQITYDISKLSQTYTRFITKAGVDASRGSNGNGVICIVTVSNNGSNWTELYKSPAVKGSDEALDIDVNIEGYKYLRITFNHNGNNGSDHAVIADCKLVKKGYVPVPNYTKINTLEYYDNILGNEKNIENNIKNNYRLILEREFVNKLDYDTIQMLVEFYPETKETLDWLLSSNENIEQVIEVGELRNSVEFIKVLANLYNTYKNELDKKDGDVYQKMMIGLAAGYTSDTIGDALNFGRPFPTYDYIERYKIMKDIYDEGLFQYGKYFKTYHIELFRDFMNVAARNDELRWLNYRGREKKYSTGSYAYMSYVRPGYNNPAYWAEENREKYDTKWHLTENGVPYGDGILRLWMVQEKGGICWNLSRNATAVIKMMGRPSIGVYQPGHESAYVYVQNDNGVGIWEITNNIFGWGASATTWYGGKGTRTLFNWNNKPYTDKIINANHAGNNGAYLYLAQANLNDYENYKKSLYLNLLANSYSDHNEKIKVYNKSLEISKINLDTYDYKMNSYKALEKTSKEWHDFSAELIDNLTFYPMAYNDMLKVIRPYLTKTTDLIDIDQKEAVALNRAKVATANDVYHYGACREVANKILGSKNRDLATFSFDGENANKIVLSSDYDERDIAWHYSIDGGTTLSAQLEEHSITLSADEVSKISAENDIKIYIVGVSTQRPMFVIDIKPSTGLPSTVYANDLENKLIASVPTIEWKLNENDNWTSYRVKEPDLTGNKSVIFRMGSTGVYMPSDSTTYTFTADNQPDTRKYIPISHLAIHAYSTQSKDSARPYYAPNVIDGNANTLWHTDFAQNVLQQPIKPFVSIKLDNARNISALEFTQKKYPGKPGDPDDIKNARVYVSTDGESWILGGSIENCTTYGSLYAVEFNKPVYGQYVKIEMDTKNMFASLALVNLYEDTTITTIANFSFNGENAGKLLLVDDFKGAKWEYSLDGGKTWKAGSGDEHQLTNEELGQINVDNKIKIRLLEGNKESTIEIQNQEAPVISAYLNDLENRLIGITNTDNLEWKTVSNMQVTTHSATTQEWTLYSDKEPIVEGDTKLLIRKKATGTLLASEPVEFVFTADNQADTAKYIPIKNIASVSVSNTTVPSRGEEAKFAIDGLPTTMWHSNRTTTTMHDPRWITIELDEPTYISQIEYVRKPNYAYGIPRNGKVSVSMDGENWTEVLVFENLYDAKTSAELTASDDRKMLKMTKVEQAKYVKIECTKSCDNVHGDRNGVPMDYFFSAAMINLFEDSTKIEKVVPTAEIEYSTKELTNKNVTATLVNESTEITITNNSGNKTYTFEDNGEFTFEFTDKRGTKGTATAKVDWICKTLPNATVVYSTTNLTNQNVTATITFDRDNVKIVDEKGNILQTITTGNAYTYTFTENGTHEIKFVGPYGNEGKTTAKVNWIDKKVPVGTIEYSSKNLSNQDITATITFDKENLTVKGGNTHLFTANGEHIFEFEDKAGNKGTATAKVDWIDTTLPKATIVYSTTNPTNKNVTATVTFDKDNVRILDKEGNTLQTVTKGNTYTNTFKENGTHEIKYVGPAGNMGTLTLTVNCIDKVAPIGTIKYSTKELTNKNVIATIEFNEENVKITNNEGKNTYTFELDGEFEFQFEDKAGNKGTALAEVDWIDKVEVKASIDYDIKDITNKDVTATITFDKPNVKILNNGGKNTYTFIENGIFEFEFIGPAGNKGTATAEVTWIDKIPPIATVTYSTQESTTEPVTARVTFDENGVTMVNEAGKPIKNGTTYVFTKNGTYTFYYIGPLGNKGTAVAEVTWIREKTADEIYAENKAQYIKTIKDYQAKVKAEELNNKKINSEEKALVIEAYNKLKEEDKAPYTEFITKIKQGGKPVITQITTKPLQYKVGDDIDLYSLITIKDNEDGNIVSNKNNVKVTTNLNTKKAGTYNVAYEITDNDGNKTSLTVKIIIREKTADEIYAENKAQYIKTIKDYQAKVKAEELNNKKINSEEKALVIEAYNKLKEEDKAPYTEFITKIKQGGKPVITKITTKPLQYKVGDDIDLYSLITIKDNEDGNIISNKNNVKVTTNLNTKKAGTYDVDYEVTDSNGNKSTLKLQIVIEKEIENPDLDPKPVIPAKATIKYSTNQSTTDPVTATITFDENDVKITNNDGKNTYVFTKNGTYTFYYVGPLGNKGTAVAEVTWIKEKTADEIYAENKVQYIKTIKDYQAKAKAEELNNNKTNSEEKALIIEAYNKLRDEDKAPYTEFITKIKQGGKPVITKVTTKPLQYKLGDNIDLYSLITVKDNEDGNIAVNKNNVKVTTNLNTKKAGTYDVDYEVTDSNGNKSTLKLQIAIEKESEKTDLDAKPVVPVKATIKYSTNQSTTEPVTATITFNKNDVKITNNGGKNTYTFTENGSFEFIYKDSAGNENRTTAIVNWIDTEVSNTNNNDNNTENSDNKNNTSNVSSNEQNTNVSEINQNNFEGTLPNTGKNTTIFKIIIGIFISAGILIIFLYKNSKRS